MSGSATKKFNLLLESMEWSEEELESRLRARCDECGVDPEEVLALIRQDGDARRYFPDRDASEIQRPDIDGFTLHELLGEGGMGRVFRATQHRPSRDVAIKIVSAQRGSPTSRLRFLAEQEALARLNHPGIAQFFAAGECSDHDLYFAMEFVRGHPITRYCDENRLSIRERVELVAQVCDALQHAHQKQILHRDLKPGNILVARVDDATQVKVIDFGIAKALDGELTDQTLMTGENILGTPAYMSPEALRGDADTRSDIYALGVVLFELLVGGRPFEQDQPSRGELLFRVHNAERPLPSRQLLRAENAAEISQHRSTQTSSLAQAIAGDLDAIVCKATEKIADDRYDTAAELGADLRRYLNDEPILARRYLWREQTRKFFRRNAGVAWSLLAAVLAVVTGAAVSTAGWLEARDQTRAAQTAARESAELSGFLADIFALADPNQNVMGEVTARELVDKAAQQLPQRFPNQPLLRARFARTIADIYSKLGIYDAAEPLLEEAKKLQDTLGETSTAEYAETLYDLGSLAFKRDQYDAAETWYRHSLTLREALDGDSSSELAHSLNGLGVTLVRKKEYAAARAPFHRAAAIAREQDDPESLVRALVGLATIDTETGNLDNVLTLYTEARDSRIRALGAVHPHVAASEDNLCFVFSRMQRWHEAADSCLSAVRIYKETLGDDFPELFRTQNRQIRILKALGDDEGLHQVRLDLIARYARRDGPVTEDVLRLQHTAGYQLWLRGEYDRAMPFFRASLEGKRELFGSEEYTTALSAMGLGGVLWKLGNYAEAETLLLESAPLIERAKGDHNHTSLAYEYIIGLYLDRDADGDMERARVWSAKLKAMIERKPDIVDDDRLARIEQWHERLSAG